MVRIVRFHELGSADVLQIEDLPLDEPGPGEVRLRVEAIGLNRAETLFREGQYIVQPELPSRIGYDAAGVVDAIGEGVTSVAVGDRVHTIPTFSAEAYGVYGESTIVPAHAVAKTPDNISAAQATTLGVQFLTVYFALVDIGRLAAGQTLLTTAASSSTGIASIQLAKALGATVIATSRTSAKKQALLDQGADHVIATQEEDLAARVAEITSGAGAHVVFDPIGGPMLEPIAEAVAPMGTVIVYGLLEPSAMTLPPFPLLLKCFNVRGYQVFNYTGSPDFPRQDDAIARANAYLFEQVEKGNLVPLVDKRSFELADIADAHRYMESNQQVGKIVVNVEA
ncbi:MAG: zinc-dependent alcohol dehydrogenase family protein [Planctomycetota bacterium]|nr:zinc-dependent alcohol dehydrogenase family protein [Planctomycetota bacterium]